MDQDGNILETKFERTWYGEKRKFDAIIWLAWRKDEDGKLGYTYEYIFEGDGKFKNQGKRLLSLGAASKEIKH